MFRWKITQNVVVIRFIIIIDYYFFLDYQKIKIMKKERRKSLLQTKWEIVKVSTVP